MSGIVSGMEIPKSTPFSVYCQARAVAAMGRDYPTSMCGNEPQLLFAAMVGVEDALRFKRALESGRDHPYPTEAEFAEQVGRAFPSWDQEHASQ